MNCVRSKSELAVLLSKLKGFSEPKVRQEQYLIDSEICASALWTALLFGDMQGKTIADLGCGTGLLGIGALLLGSKQVFFVDSDKKALRIAKDNISKVKSEGYILRKYDIICQDVKSLYIKADVVVQNPPFGTKIKHRDVLFLEKALQIAPVVYTFHKSETKAFLQRFSLKNKAKITHIWDYRFPLKAAFSFHRRQIHRVNVSCFRFETTA